jgi:hypothetical protein
MGVENNINATALGEPADSPRDILVVVVNGMLDTLLAEKCMFMG